MDDVGRVLRGADMRKTWKKMFILALLMPGEDSRKTVTAHQIPGGTNVARRTLNARWSQYGTKDIKCQVEPIWHKGH